MCTIMMRTKWWWACRLAPSRAAGVRSKEKEEIGMDLPRNPSCPKCGIEMHASLGVPAGASCTGSNQDRFITLSCMKCGYVRKHKRWWQFWK